MCRPSTEATRIEWMRIAPEMEFSQRFEQELEFTRCGHEDVEARAEAEGLSLAEQTRLWE
jgi:hypothetical protein